MAVYGISGKLYFGAITTTLGAGGTLLDDVQGREVDAVVSMRTALFHTGRANDMIAGVHRGVHRTAIIIRARNVDANAINMMFKEAAASGGFKSSGNTKAMALAAKTGLLIRPNDTDDKTFYMPNATILPPEILRIGYSPARSYLDEQEVLFVAARESENTEPAAMYDMAANIAAAYAGITS